CGRRQTKSRWNPATSSEESSCPNEGITMSPRSNLRTRPSTSKSVPEYVTGPASCSASLRSSRSSDVRSPCSRSVNGIASDSSDTGIFSLGVALNLDSVPKGLHRLHHGSSGDVAMAFSVGKGQKFRQLFVRLECVGGEVVQGADRLSVLCRQQLLDRQAG